MNDKFCHILVAAAAPGARIAIARYQESGYYATDYDHESLTEQSAENLVNELNERLGVSKAVREAMTIGSMMGWAVPGAAAAHAHFGVTATPMTVDLTPVGLQTPEGSAKVASAIGEFEDSAAALANAAITFFDTHEEDILHCMEMYDGIADDVAEIRKLIVRRRKAQEAFLRSMAGA